MEEPKEENHFVRAVLFGDEASERSNILRCIINQKPASIGISFSSLDRAQYTVQYKDVL